jgi:hypothetical protein
VRWLQQDRLCSSFVGPSWDPPTPKQEIYLRPVEQILESTLWDFNKVFSEAVSVYKLKVEQAKLSLFPEGEALDLNWKPKEKK